MATNYSKGYRLEWKSKKILEKNGWMAFRSPASKSDMDVIALDKKNKLFIQCKTSKKDALYVYGLDGLIKTAKKCGAIPLLVYSFYYTPIYVKEVKNKNEKAFRKEENIELIDYLGGF